MAKSRSTLGRRRGPDVAWKLDDRAGILRDEHLGFTAKANGQRPTIVRLLPEIEMVDGQPVVQPMRMVDEDGEPYTTDFFRKVTVAELGSGSNFTCFIADPSDAEEDMPRSDYPVMRLREALEDALEANEEWAMPYFKWFKPHGKYDNIDFPWPIQYTVLQCFAYLQPGCNHKDTINDHARRLSPHPKYGHVLASPEKKFMFIKGSGADALADIFLGRVSEDSEEFKVPADYLGPDNGMGLFISGEKEIDEEEKTERSVCTVQPFDLAHEGFYVPNGNDLVKFWTPWDKVFRLMTYDEQVKKLAQIFGQPLIDRVFGQASAPAGPTGPAGPAGPTSAPGPGQAESQTGGWTTPQAPADPAPQQAQQAAPQQQATQAQQTAQTSWTTPSGGAQAASAPAAAQQGPPQQGVSDATATTPETPAGPMTAEDVKARFGKYSQNGPS